MFFRYSKPCIYLYLLHRVNTSYTFCREIHDPNTFQEKQWNKNNESDFYFSLNCVYVLIYSHTLNSYFIIYQWQSPTAKSESGLVGFIDFLFQLLELKLDI